MMKQLALAVFSVVLLAACAATEPRDDAQRGELSERERMLQDRERQMAERERRRAEEERRRAERDDSVLGTGVGLPTLGSGGLGGGPLR